MNYQGWISIEGLEQRDVEQYESKRKQRPCKWSTASYGTRVVGGLWVLDRRINTCIKSLSFPRTVKCLSREDVPWNESLESRNPRIDWSRVWNNEAIRSERYNKQLFYLSRISNLTWSTNVHPATILDMTTSRMCHETNVMDPSMEWLGSSKKKSNANVTTGSR